jgi:hypothetical protein
MVTHTPGPWRVGDGGSWGALVKDGNGDGICIPCSGRLGPTDAANARLIAAAPELLEAVRKAELLYAEWSALALPAALDTPAYELVTRIVQENRALLAKIEGAK